MVEFIQVKGNHREMGVQQAENFKIKEIIAEVMKSDIMQDVKPKFVPIFLVKFALGLMGRMNIKKAVQKYVPNQHEKLIGIAEGAGISKNLTYGLHYIEVYTGDPKTTAYISPGCTQLFALPPATADGSLLFGRNYDFPKALQPYQMVRLDEPDDKLKCLTISQYPLAGAHMGINEKGLAIGINYARTWEKYPDDFSFKGVPPTLIVQEVLENFETTEEAIKYISNFPARSNAQHYGIMDESGDACVLETTHTDFAIRRPKDGIMAHSNTFRTEKFFDHNCPDDHHWKIKKMRHISYIKSPKMRYERAHELLVKHKGDITMETFKEILGDHQYPSSHPEKNNGEPDDFTVCTHGETGITLASIIIRPKTRQMFVTDRQPCHSMYEEFKF
ncbi:MAG: C45 family autoproteolytic acyltransferase/hydrolase [Candidatus Helarchaeota archaeon]